MAIYELRLTHCAKGASHQVRLELRQGKRTWRARSYFDFMLSPEEEERLRWYFEDFLHYYRGSAPKIAQQIEDWMAEIGTDLFDKVFEANKKTRLIWQLLRNNIGCTRIAIVPAMTAVCQIPWEMMRASKAARPLALASRAFIRALPGDRLRGKPARRGPIRILVVICRPRGRDDVPFRSIAKWLLTGIASSDKSAFTLNVLRPPTFAQLGKTLRDAFDEGKPYHIVHFDGHGAYGEVKAPAGLDQFFSCPSPAMLVHDERHGYLVFENPETTDHRELVDGSAIGHLLSDTGVPILILNACRSAYSKPRCVPKVRLQQEDLCSQARAFGSLAQEALAAGVSGVVAMTYNVYVATAAQLVEELYSSLARGKRLGEALNNARRSLTENRMRFVGRGVQLQDWMVPVVHEAVPLRSFRKERRTKLSTIILKPQGISPADSDHRLLPRTPDVGFRGMDEDLFALDREFDRNPIVLLHGWAGSGKTTLAGEFGRWYAGTGGVQSPVLFTSFENHDAFAQVLERVKPAIDSLLRRSGIGWPDAADILSKESLLQILCRIPVLWIWDNVEQIAGFPASRPSAWSGYGQQELADFLREAKRSKARFLLISRRDERNWLADLPTRICISALPMLERLHLARAIAGRYGRRLADVAAWRPLLAFTEGNPLTLTVLVGQALRERLRTRAQITSFLARVRSGEEDFPDEPAASRSRSLGSSLAYGFANAFTDSERRLIALLHLFQRSVEVRTLCWMGYATASRCLPEIKGLRQNDWLSLLDRAAEVGLLTARGKGLYDLHPALPWFLQRLFDDSYANQASAVRRSFAESMSRLALNYSTSFTRGDQSAITSLQQEEANLVKAWEFAREDSWWPVAIEVMEGLRILFENTGRRKLPAAAP